MTAVIDQFGGPIVAGLIGLFLAIVLGRISFSAVKESARALSLVVPANQKKANLDLDLLLACAIVGFTIAIVLAASGAYLVASYAAGANTIFAITSLAIVGAGIAYLTAIKLRRYELVQLEQVKKTDPK